VTLLGFVTVSAVGFLTMSLGLTSIRAPTALAVLVAACYIAWALGRPLAVLIAGRKRQTDREPVGGGSGVSVVIPCCNTSAAIRPIVNSILSQSHRPIEVVLVENNSTDDTWRVIEALSSELPEVRGYRVVPAQGDFGASVAVNHGVRMATFDVIIRMDDDTVMAPGMVESALFAFRRDTAAVAANLRVRNVSDSIATRLQAIEYMLAMELNRGFQAMLGSIVCCSGGLSIYRRTVIVEADGFCTSPRWVSEDLDMTLRAQRLGRVEMSRPSIGYTTVPASLLGVVRQRFRWGATGIVGLYIHRNGLGRKAYWYDGRVGFFGLPMLGLIKVRDMLAVGAPIIAVAAIVDGYLGWLIGAAGVRVAVLAVQMAILTPALYTRQGAWSYWLTLPFVLMYGPLILGARCAGAWVGLWHIGSLRKERVAIERVGLAKGARAPRGVVPRAEVGDAEREAQSIGFRRVGWRPCAVAAAGAMLIVVASRWAHAQATRV
jgi:cellulose synthase/poly-beta-1,6-N-acetylglucosamine synthase-like glycosyltransferase